MTDEELHGWARECAKKLVDPDRKQLRFNEIVEAAKRFYPRNLRAGISELVKSCDRVNNGLENDLYVAKDPMWKRLEADYGWMLTS